MSLDDLSHNNSASYIEIPSKRLPIFASVDVLIVGGGTAGFIAAIAAARTGANTLLIERGNYLGGQLTGTYCTTPGLFGDSNGDQIIGGIPWEVMERMEQNGAAIIDRDLWKVQIFPEAIKTLAFQMIEESHAELLLYSGISEVLLEERRIKGVVFEGKSGRQIILAKTFIDASGDGDLAYLAGCSYDKLPKDELWQTSVDLSVVNVDPVKVIAWAENHSDRCFPGSEYDTENPDQKGIRNMVEILIPNEDTEIIVGEKEFFKHRGVMPTIKLLIHRNIARIQGSVNIDGTDIKNLTFAEIEGRKRAINHFNQLKAQVDGFEDAFILGESHLGVRETRRIRGEYTLTIKDLNSNTRFSDVIALNCRALDRHMHGDQFEISRLKGNHDIPIRSLIPLEFDNLLVAGRCLSCDHDAHASLRGAATCMATGHAAGTTAALAAKHNGLIHNVNIQLLQEQLQKQKAILHIKPGN